nr:phosphate-starvation-inducible PsiE family protein [Geomonas nitrogeniifigens]
MAEKVSRARGGGGMLRAIKRFEKGIIMVLVVLMSVVLLLSTLELAWIIIVDIISPPVLLLDISELLDIFGLFMLVLIGIELLDTIAKTYMAESVDHAQIVMAVAIIAIARKVIILDVKELSGLALLGIAAIILALSVGYFLIKKRDSAAG